MRLFLFFTFVLILIYSCGDLKNSGEKKVDSSSTSVLKEKVSAFSADSLDILYFKKPFTDSSRYTRFFNAVKVSDSSFEASLARVVSGIPSLMEKPRGCLSEGKIIVPKGGDAFKVYYFSRLGNDSCRYVYEIKEGLFLYYNIIGDLTLALDRFEKDAREVQ